MKTVSLKLYDTIVKGKKMLSEDSISRISSYVQTQRVDDVCFMNRSGNAVRAGSASSLLEPPRPPRIRKAGKPDKPAPLQGVAFFWLLFFTSKEK